MGSGAPAIVDAAGIVILSRSYDAYGTVRYAAGTGSSRLGYTGELQDPWEPVRPICGHGTIIRDRAIPAAGCFAGFVRQPQSLNRYAYAEGNPVVYVDPSGHCPLCIIAGILASFASSSAMPVTVIEIFRPHILYVAEQRSVNPVILGAIIITRERFVRKPLHD